MSYNGRSYVERAEAEKRKINRILTVREQSNEIAQKILKKTRTAKEQELKKLQQIKEKELGEWKKKSQFHIQKQIDGCIENFGNAHIAAVDASCEEDECLREQRDEQDLMAAVRGRVAMLQVQREREREIENKLLKKKRSQQKTVGIQADSLAQSAFSKSLINNKPHVEAELSGEEEENEIYSTKPNLHKHSEQYNPQNYTSHSVDSSNNCDSDDGDFVELENDESSKEIDESEVEFNQITKLLRNGLHKSNDNDSLEEINEILSSDTESLSHEIKAPKKVTIKQPSPKKNKKGILKKSPAKQKQTAKNKSNKNQLSPMKSRKEQPAENRVRYVDFGNKYETSYVPDKNLIVRSEKSKTNARENAQIQTDDDLITNRINDDILKQLTELRSQEALEKEKIRRDYERLRYELDELSKQEQEAKAKSNVFNNLSRDQLLRKEETRQKKMNEAAENAMKKNIITCPPVARNEKSARQKSNEINVAAPTQYIDKSDQVSSSLNSKRSSSEINNLVKVEKLKDLLEKINHQKRLLLNEIEKSEDIPGPDLEKVMDCIKKLELEKAALNDEKIDESKMKKIEELNEREKKIKEREVRLEKKIRELFKEQKQNVLKSSSSSSSEPVQSDSSSTTSAENTKKIVQTPVEIIIKVQQPKSPHKKSKKSYRCVDTLNRQPGKVYPKTPIRKKKSVESESDIIPEVEKSQQQTQTSPVGSDAPKPILKNSQLKQISIPPKENLAKSTKSTASSLPQKPLVDPEDFSVSTVYRELPPQINLMAKESEKAKRKLNPMLMDYITRLLNMNKNVSNHLNVDVSSVATPGSSTINTSENVSSSVGEINFDEDRMNRLQKFIDDNHSFISEIDESLEKVQVQKKQDENMGKIVEDLWRDILRQKKSPQGTETHSKGSSNARQNKPRKAPSSAGHSVQSSKKINQPQIPQKEPKKTIKLTRSQSVPESSQSTESKSTQRPKITQEDMTNVTKYIESQMLNNYSEYTANCQRRIAELSQMMEKVRQEKIKLIENSLSSNEFNNFTEYKEIAQASNNKTNLQPSVTNSSDPKESPSRSNRDDPPSEEINNILQYQTRPFGVSKDSGISVSRPVTSSDFRESPDVRVSSEENNNNNLFQPILKDIPKVPRMKITTVDGDTQTLTDVTSIIKQQQEEKQQKKLKPPLSLRSPQFEKQQHEPHELSTIVEIETPTASKNFIQEEQSGVGGLHSFPNFEEYAMGGKKQVDESKQTEISFPDLNDLKKALPDMNVKTFVDQEDVSLMDISKDVDNENNEEIPSNASSLMDIMEELKKRHLFEESFQIYYEEENKDNRVQAGFEKDDKTTPTATKQILLDPVSPKRKQAQSRIVIKTPERVERNEIARTPTKNKHTNVQKQINLPAPSSPNSNDTLSGILEIEKDFQAQGLGWAASTLKRTEESAKKDQESSSSSGSRHQDSVRIELGVENSSSSSDGQPLNLKDFLRRELLTRSRTDKYLSDDSSLSSRFMRSLLKSSNSSPNSSSSNDPKSESSQNAKLRTSTPVRISSENLIKTSSQIFVGAESVSSVKDSSDSSKDKSDKSKSL